MEFEWDEVKNEKNFKKHDVWFEQAKSVFWDEQAKTTFDSKHSSDDEDRWLMIGASGFEGLVLIVVFCYRLNKGQEFIRIISARKAVKKEIKEYER